MKKLMTVLGLLLLSGGLGGCVAGAGPYGSSGYDYSSGYGGTPMYGTVYNNEFQYPYGYGSSGYYFGNSQDDRGEPMRNDSNYRGGSTYYQRPSQFPGNDSGHRYDAPTDSRYVQSGNTSPGHQQINQPAHKPSQKPQWQQGDQGSPY
jgi:hypothetical protein